MVNLQLINLDDLYASTEKKILVNTLHENLDSGVKINKQTIIDSLYTTQSSLVIDKVPKCVCGESKGRPRIGKVCRVCGTEVAEYNQMTDPLIWIKSLDNSRRFVKPYIWSLITDVLHGKHDILRWLSDESYKLVKVPSVLYKLASIMGGRTYNNLIDYGLDNVLTYLMSDKSFSSNKKEVPVADMLDILKRYGDDIYSTYLPMVNKNVFVVEKVKNSQRTNTLLPEIINLVISFNESVYKKELTIEESGMIMSSTISKLSAIYRDYVKDHLGKKEGTFRKLVYSSKAHFTFRCVITIRDVNLPIDGITAPWVVGLTSFKPHLINILVRRKGYSVKDALALINSSYKVYNPIIGEILDTLISESPEGGLPIILARNPTLLIGSLLRVRIDSFSKDPSIKTISMSSMVCMQLNADYDGDEVNITILVSNELAELTNILRPHLSLAKTTTAHGIQYSNLGAPAQTNLTNYLNDKSPTSGKDTIVKDILSRRER